MLNVYGSVLKSLVNNPDTVKSSSDPLVISYKAYCKGPHVAELGVELRSDKDQLIVC